ncbi:MAG: hypothetical protein A2Y07_09630 [Planctomycetes bacterium GWF2_50_10]|nr:MAG: hypothetical protein A2Y07_09630 [Planctomycetes bacterium GWF2_50_10]
MRYLGILCVFFLVGCHSKQTKQPLERICAPASTQQAFDTSVKVLEKMHFTIEKADLQHGIITTRPLPAAQFFEFWRSDTRGAFNFAESNLQSVERTAEIQITTVEGQACVDCTVFGKRLSLPEKEITSPTDVPGMFTKSASNVQRMQMNKQQRAAAQWIDLGPDPQLQSYILSKIQRKLSKLKGK